MYSGKSGFALPLSAVCFSRKSKQSGTGAKNNGRDYSGGVCGPAVNVTANESRCSISVEVWRDLRAVCVRNSDVKRLKRKPKQKTFD